MADKKKTPPGDFNADDLVAKSEQHATDIAGLLKRVTEIEANQKVVDLKAENEGTKLYAKVTEAIQKSTDVQTEVKKIVWEAIKSKVLIGVIALVSIIATDLIIRAIPNILKAVSGS